MSRTTQESAQLRERIDAIQGWYHAIDLGDGIWTPGPFDVAKSVEDYRFPESLEGKRVLDVGTSNGFFAIEFERRGAREVVGLDLPTWISGDWNRSYRREYMKKSPEEQRYIDEHTMKKGFELVVEELGQGRIRKEELTIYEISPERLGVFDLVFSGAMMMHVRDPILALHRLYDVLVDDGVLILSIATIEDGADMPMARFAGEPEQCNFWQPNAACVKQMLRCCDFEVIEEGQLVSETRDGSFKENMFFCHAKPTGR